MLKKQSLNHWRGVHTLAMSSLALIVFLEIRIVMLTASNRDSTWDLSVKLGPLRFGYCHE